MKTKIYIGIIAAVMTSGFKAGGQTVVAGNYGNENTLVVINNYYNYDFHYSSRINRFHRSYVAFDYYSPVFTDVYWYSYQPYTWGLTIYGGGRVGIGVTYNFPIYYSYWDYPWYYGWDYAWYGGTYWWRYDPFYTAWYSPVVINVRIGNWWPRHYYSYNVRYRWYGDYRPVYNTYNYYYYNTPSGGSGSTVNYSRRTTPPVTTAPAVQTGSRSDGYQTATQNRRTAPASVENQTNRERRGDMGNNNSLNPGRTDNVNRGINSGNNPGRRETPQNNNNKIRQGDQGNNNSLNPGNTSNVNRGVNSGNNPGRRNDNLQVNRDQGNAVSRPVITTPSNNNSRQNISATPVPSSRQGNNATVNENRRPSVSNARTEMPARSSSVQHNAGTPSQRSSTVKPSANVSRPASGTTGKSSSGSEQEKSKSENNSGSRRK